MNQVIGYSVTKENVVPTLYVCTYYYTIYDMLYWIYPECTLGIDEVL